MTAMGGESGAVKGLSQKDKELMYMDNSMVNAGVELYKGSRQ